MALTGKIQLYDSVVTDWAQRAVNNGSTAPTTGTKNALNDFILGLKNDGLFSQMIAVNCIVPDHISASLTPLIHNSGSDPWTPIASLPTLSTAGIFAGVSGGNVSTGIDANAICTTSDMGLSIIVNYASGAPQLAFGGGTAAIYGTSAPNYQVGSYGGWSFGTGADPGFNTGDYGYFSANRTATNAAALYIANRTFGHVTYATTTGTSGAIPGAGNIIQFPNSNNTPAGISVNVNASFVAIHHGLTAAQSANLFKNAAWCRRALGGGTP